MPFTLTLLDTTGIQDYIFSSNRLQENIGASELVYRATTLWAFKALEDAGIKNHNIRLITAKNSEGKEIVVGWNFTDACIEKEAELQAEVLQAAGGNALILFRDQPASIKFVQELTRRLLIEAPGLTLLAQHLNDFDFLSDKLSDARKTLETNMREHKISRLPSAPTLGLGVTAMCDSTGMVAVRTPVGTQTLDGEKFKLLVPGQDEQIPEQTRLISRETTFKLAARDLANRRLKHTVGDVTNWYEFPFDIDNLGRISGEESYVAVVHADGNRMGDHVAAVAKGAKDNRDFINASRSFSNALDVASQATLIEIVESIVASIVDGMVAGKIPLVEDKYHTYIPFRPLVFGGDDITFLCNGQLGVELATQYLKIFEKNVKAIGAKEDTHPLAKIELEKLHACAGVSIVKMHYPFARAYKLSEELAGSAKSLTREIDCSALDWHFAQSGLSGSLETIRKREYAVDSGKLYLRPLTLDNWTQVEYVMEEFNGNYWGEKHNKVLGLREPLRDGPQAVEKYRQDFDLKELPKFAVLNVRINGWLDGVCYYFDAVELLDHHVALKK